MHVKVGRVGQLVVVALAASCAAVSLTHATRAPNSQRDHPGDRRSESGLPCLLLVHLATGAEAATLVASVYILQQSMILWLVLLSK